MYIEVNCSRSSQLGTCYSTRETLQRILGSPLSDLQWLQATLPVSKGGLGLRASSDHCFAAYVLSLLASQDLKGQILGLGSEECPPPPVTTELMDSLTAKKGSDTSLACLRDSSQREVSLQIDLNNHQILSAKISDLGIVREVARLGSLGLPHAGAWLNVVPSPTLGLHFHPR